MILLFRLDGCHNNDGSWDLVGMTKEERLDLTSTPLLYWRGKEMHTVSESMVGHGKLCSTILFAGPLRLGAEPSI
jgi:hypothetical protein